MRVVPQIAAHVLVTTLALLIAGGRAHGQASGSVRTGSEGFLGTFAVLHSARRPASDDELAAFDPHQCDSCEVAVSPDARIDLHRLLGRRTRAATLGVMVHADAEQTVHLFVGFEGRARIFVDGQQRLDTTRAREKEDDLYIPLALEPGEHRLVFDYNAPERGRWRTRVRILNEEFSPGVRLSLGSAAIPDDAAARSVLVNALPRLDGTAPVVRLVASRNAGGIDTPVPVVLGDAQGVLPCGGTVAQSVPMPRRGSRGISAEVDGQSIRVARSLALDRPLVNAMASLTASLDRADESDRAPIQWRVEEAARVIANRDSDRSWRQWLRSEATRIDRALDAQQVLFPMRGHRRMAHASVIDSTAQPYELFVPPQYRARRSWPLVVTLHGFKGNAGDYFRNTFGLARDYENGESLLAHGRISPSPTQGEMVVIAPQGRGQTHYRHAGEVDVLEAIADVRARLNIDPRRIYITGGSMGGTGAATLPTRVPDLFAASAALAGYHDQRVRQDTHHATLTPAEVFLQAERSDIDWVENTHRMPWLLVRGTRDRPLAWTRRFAARLQELGYRVEHREPELGHNVWTETYAEGAIFEYFARFRRPADPDHVILVTARERTQTSHWITIDGRAFSDRFARVDARKEGPQGPSDAAVQSVQITATTEAVSGITFSPEGVQTLRVVIDDQEFEGASPMSLCRRHIDGIAGPWRVHALPTRGRKQAGVSGPIRDVFHDRLVFVVGTQDASHTLLNRAVARDVAHPKGWDVHYPIVDDVNVTEEMIASSSLVLVGPPTSNLLTARYNSRLPIRFEGAEIVLGSQRFSGTQLGTAFVAPNPDAPERALLVLAGPSPLGTSRARFLPDILPDYVVFDEGIQNARGSWSCGGARSDDGTDSRADPVPCAMLAEGFFDMMWRLPD